jgi:hypothetical protein
MNSRRVSRHRISIGLDENVCTSSATWLNQFLADIMALRDLYMPLAGGRRDVLSVASALRQA